MGQNVVDHLLHEHEEIRGMFSEYDAASGEAKAEQFRRIVEKLARHEAAEEEVLYPALRRRVTDGGDLADARIAEEQEAERMLADLEEMGTEHPDFEARFRTLRQDVLEHAEMEELHVFPVVREEFGDDELERMGTWLERAEAMAPTHPHPSAPKTPPGIYAAGAVAAIFDRARDVIADLRDGDDDEHGETRATG